MRSTILNLLFGTVTLMAAPTELREWHSTAGTTIKAVALTVKGDEVMLKAEDGREFAVPLDKFAEEDQEALRSHFGIELPEPGQPVGSGVPLLGETSEFPVGEVSGPIDTGKDSTYYIYVPESLRQDRPAPFMLFASGGGAKAGAAEKMVEGAEINGWVVAASVESRNGRGHPEKNHEYAKDILKHVADRLPIDEKRVYFTGSSGGGAMSFYNALRIDSAGNMPMNAYSPDGRYPKDQYCYGIGGVTDFNRYATAEAVAGYKDRGFHRFKPGGHGQPAADFRTEGITWLNGRYLGDRRSDEALDAERLDFEASVLKWVAQLRDRKAHRAYYWCDFLIEDYQIEGENADLAQEAREELAEDSDNVRYAEGIRALDEFSEEVYATQKSETTIKGEPVPEEIIKAAEALTEAYAGVPEIESLARDLAKPAASF